MRRIIASITVLFTALTTACAGSARSSLDEAGVTSPCAGLQDAEVDASVNTVRANVQGAEALREGGGVKLPPHLVGAVLEVRATPGMTAQWLDRVLECNAARHATASCDSNDGCLFALAGTYREVTTTPAGFAVAIRARDGDVASQIEQRALALVSRTP